MLVLVVSPLVDQALIGPRGESGRLQAIVVSSDGSKYIDKEFRAKREHNFYLVRSRNERMELLALPDVHTPVPALCGIEMIRIRHFAQSDASE